MVDETDPMLGGNSDAEDSTNYHAISIPPLTPVDNGDDSYRPSVLSSGRQTALLLSGVVDKITLTWHDINVFVNPENRKLCDRWRRGSEDQRIRSSKKQILRGVDGIVRPRELLAIMGASGAGKTTLLNVLTQRIQKSLMVDGDVRINGSIVSPDTLIALSAYVQQDDLFIGTLTVREQLVFQALVRMDANIPYQQRMTRVEEVIKELGLTKCADTIIGVPGSMKSISGGEMKRLAFASEVLTNPPLMFCDEPTSGLDSFMAQSVVSVLKQMACKGKTIIATIHQPSSEIFAMFDRLMLMAEGRVVYLGGTSGACEFFRSQGYECPANYNPADYYIHTLAIMPGHEDERRKRVEVLADQFEECQTGKLMKLAVAAWEVHDERLIDENWGKKKSPYKATWFMQLRALLWRSSLTIIREPLLLKVRIFQTLMVAAFMALMFFGQTLNQEGVMNINGALFLFLTNMTFQNLFSVINVFCMEVPIFMREHGNGMYRSDSYFLAKTLAEIPMYTIIPVMFTSVCYWTIGFYPDWRNYLMACLIVTLVTNAACSFGYLISTVSKNITVALSIAPPLITPFLLFGGFFLNAKTFPDWMYWLQYLSWFRYGNEALAINQWSNVPNIQCNRPVNTTCVSSGLVVLETLDFHESNLMFDFMMLLAQLVCFRILAYIGLYLRARRS